MLHQHLAGARALLSVLVLTSGAIPAGAQPATPPSEPPREWIDPATGHRVVRLSSEPGTRSLYFHQHSLTPDGRRVIVESPSGIGAIDFATRTQKIIVPGKIASCGAISNRSLAS